MIPFAGKSLTRVTQAELHQMVADGVPESAYLDYKRELHLDERDEKKEFLRDLTAFANAQGGAILFGIEEERDAANKGTGVPKALDGIDIPNCDDLILRVDQLVKDGIDERLPAVETQCVALGNGKYVFMVRVSASLRPPHMVTLGGERRFFIRTNSGKQDMSTAQIRDAAIRGQTLIERIQSFIEGRVQKCQARAKPGPFWMLHAVPLNATPSLLNVADKGVMNRVWQLASATGRFEVTHCAEGIRAFTRSSGSVNDHLLVFRDVKIEFADQHAFVRDGERRFIACAGFDQQVFRFVDEVLKLHSEIPVQFPIVVSIGLFRVLGYAMPPVGVVGEWKVTEEDSIAPEPVVLVEPPADAKTFARPLLDYVWNAFGLPRCLGYDESGTYRGYP